MTEIDDEDYFSLDTTPTGEEEERYLFNEGVDPVELNPLLEARERLQDMQGRRDFSDRAHHITLIWVWFLVILPFVQIICSFFDAGLTDGQFIAVVTTTTAAVFGFWLLVGQYLFPKRTIEIKNGNFNSRTSANNPSKSG